MKLIPFNEPVSILTLIRASEFNKPFTIHPQVYENVKKLAKSDKKYKYSCSNDENYCVICKIGIK